MSNEGTSFPQSKELTGLYNLAAEGLLNGDLVPLKDYMLAGGPMVGFLTELLVDAIRGDGEYKLGMKARQRGHRSFNARYDAYEKKQRLGISTLRRLRDLGDKCFEAVICEQMGAHKVSRATVTNALAMVRRELALNYGEFANLAALEAAFPEHRASMRNGSTIYTVRLDSLRPSDDRLSNN